ncbi:hypothetical protein ACFO0O_16560 [Cobetia amphilecti]|uniref:Uncharacterized protein n=1 Tax=Cobetia amphilecti TaxID=1055104 RepID=A0ABT6UQ72_9GAMM|nr:hypothetical protein [Cobetia amphilecti]MDI5884860.1 hypothetical protein [Cobetia amphilecti]
MSLKEIKARLIAASKTEEDFLVQINASYLEELCKEDKVLAPALYKLHNSQKINLFEILSPAYS